MWEIATGREVHRASFVWTSPAVAQVRHHATTLWLQLWYAPTRFGIRRTDHAL